MLSCNANLPILTFESNVSGENSRVITVWGTYVVGVIYVWCLNCPMWKQKRKRVRICFIYLFTGTNMCTTFTFASNISSPFLRLLPLYSSHGQSSFWFLQVYILDYPAALCMEQFLYPRNLRKFWHQHPFHDLTNLEYIVRSHLWPIHTCGYNISQREIQDQLELNIFRCEITHTHTQNNGIWIRNIKGIHTCEKIFSLPEKSTQVWTHTVWTVHVQTSWKQSHLGLCVHKTTWNASWPRYMRALDSFCTKCYFKLKRWSPLNSPCLMFERLIYIALKHKDKQFNVAMQLYKTWVGVHVWCLNCLLQVGHA